MQVTGCINNFMNPRIAEFNNPACFNVDKMIMLSALISPFKLSNIFSELMLDYQITIKKKLNSIIKSGPAYTVVFVLHENIKCLNIKMT